MDTVLWITKDHPFLALLIGLGFFAFMFSVKPFLMWLGSRKGESGKS
ncbi:hypothetical protein [Spongorhabdus nitratireducens]